MGFSKLEWLNMLISTGLFTLFMLWISGNLPWQRRSERKRRAQYPPGWYK